MEANSSLVKRNPREVGVSPNLEKHLLWREKQAYLIGIPSQPLTSCVTSGKSLHLPEPQLPHL